VTLAIIIAKQSHVLDLNKKLIKENEKFLSSGGFRMKMFGNRLISQNLNF